MFACDGDALTGRTDCAGLVRHHDPDMAQGRAPEILDIEAQAFPFVASDRCQRFLCEVPRLFHVFVPSVLIEPLYEIEKIPKVLLVSLCGKLGFDLLLDEAELGQVGLRRH